MPFTKRLDFSAYLEGIKIPFSGGYVTSTVGSYTIAMVYTPITSALWEFRPGAHMLILYSDDSWATSHVLFDGYFTGISREKSAGGDSSIGISGKSVPWALDRVKIFELTKATAGAAGFGGQVAMQTAVQSKSSGINVEATTNDPTTQTAMNELSKPFRDYEFAPALASFLERATYPEKPYPFITRAVQERRLTERYFAESEENRNLFNRDIYSRYIATITNGAGGTYSPNDALGILLNAGFREYAELSPLGIRSGTVRQVLCKPMAPFLPPPSCNIFFRTDVTIVSMGIDYSTMPTRAYFMKIPSLYTYMPLTDIIVAPSDQFPNAGMQFESENVGTSGTVASSSSSGTSGTSGGVQKTLEDMRGKSYYSGDMTTQQKATADKIAKVAEDNGVDPKLALAIAQQESQLGANQAHETNSNGTLDSGVMGINSSHLQTPEYYYSYGQKKKITSEAINTESSNIEMGVYFIKSAYEKAYDKGYRGDDLIKETYIGYNKGNGNIGKVGPNDRKVDTVVLNNYKRLNFGATSPADLGKPKAYDFGRAAQDRTPDEDLIGLNLQIMEYPPQSYQILNGVEAKNMAIAEEAASSPKITGDPKNEEKPRKTIAALETAPEGSTMSRDGARLIPIEVEYKSDIRYADSPRKGKVQIHFQKTSDGTSSDQYVNTALKSFLEQALRKICKTLDIHEITISSTTNGVHSTNSNHYKGTALDISAINKERVLEIGRRDPVRTFQAVFDQLGAHENFGPAMLHRDGKMVSDGAAAELRPTHQNHLHVSVAGGWSPKRIVRPENMGKETESSYTDRADTEYDTSITSDATQSERAQLADYIFYLNYYSNFSCTFNLPWTPSVAIGFPCLILDSSNLDESMLGSVNSVTHSFQAQGAAGTTVAVTYYRHYKSRMPKFDGTGGNFLVPHWFDTAYFGVNRLTDEFYSNYLGQAVFSISDLNKSDPCSPSAWVESMKKEYDSILAANDYGMFKHRDLMTFDEWKRWNAVSGDSDTLNSLMFHGEDNPVIAGSLRETVDWRTPIINHVNILKRAGVRI